MRYLILSALLLAGCSTDSPVVPQSVHEGPIRPGQPSAAAPHYAGYYTDGTSWLSIGRGPDSASVVNMDGERVDFHVRTNGRRYVAADNHDWWMLATYDSSAATFWLEMDRADHKRGGGRVNRELRLSSK